MSGINRDHEAALFARIACNGHSVFVATADSDIMKRLNAVVIARNLDSWLRLYPEIMGEVSRGQASLSVPSPAARIHRDGYSRTHNPPSSHCDSRHVRGSASAISSRIKTASWGARWCGVGRET